MVERLGKYGGLFVLYALLLPCVFAEGLIDPTRPPVIIGEPVTASGSAVDKQPAGLQSVIISKSRRAAIIDGETVELGEKHGDVRLIEVNETGVVLQGAQGRQALTLFPGVKKTGKGEKTTATPLTAVEQVQSGKQKTGPVARKEKK